MSSKSTESMFSYNCSETHGSSYSRSDSNNLYQYDFPSSSRNYSYPFVNPCNPDVNVLYQPFTQSGGFCQSNRSRSRSPNFHNKHYKTRSNGKHSRPRSASSHDRRSRSDSEFSSVSQSRNRNRSSSSRSGSSESNRSSMSKFSHFTNTTGLTSIKQEKDGHLVMKPGQIIKGFYEISDIVGEGTFGRVAKCEDLRRSRSVAIKVIRAVKRYREAADLEIKVLERMSHSNSTGSHLCIQALDWFNYHGHICIVFDLMGKSIFEFMKENNFAPYPVEQVKHIAYQLCSAIRFMARCKLTHTDLKPENILFVNSNYNTVMDNQGRSYKLLHDTSIRLIDFGSATFEDEHHTTIVATRHYRAPEVILEMTWSYPCDVWAVGCIIFELYTGVTLFMTHDNLEHLAMMERVLGPIPSRFARRTKKQKYFRHGRLDWDWDNTDGRYVRNAVKPLEKYMLADSKADVQLFDLIREMLDYNPDRRITTSDSLRHPFLNEYSYSSDSRSHRHRYYDYSHKRSQRRSRGRSRSPRRYRY